MKIEKNRIYIDGANLHFTVKDIDWNFSHQRFFVYLQDKYKTNQIFLFLGYVQENLAEYQELEKIGYKLIFKETLVAQGKIKGNCDAELVLKVTSDIYQKEIKKIVLVSSDGDFACLVRFALEQNKKVEVISPFRKLSYLIKKIQNIKIIFLSDIQELLKEKAPGEDKTSQGSFS